jgi:ATP-dependent helicase/nuclease subunit B
MSSVFVIPKEEDLIARVYEFCDSNSVNDFSQNIIIFPGKRPGHYLRRFMGNRLGNPFIPPVIYSMDELMNFLTRDNNLKHAEAIDAIPILYELSKVQSPFETPENKEINLNREFEGQGLSKENGAIHDEFKKIDKFYSFGLRLFRVLEELYIEDIPYERLRSIETLIPIPEKSLKDIRFLSDLYNGFYTEIQKRGLSTRSIRYRMAADIEMSELVKRLGRFRKMIFAGFFVFTAQEKKFIKKLLQIEGQPEIILLFQDRNGISDTINTLGVRLDNSTYSPYSSLKPQIHLISAPDTHGMVKAAGTLLSEFAQLDEKTAVVLPKAESLFPLLRQGIPYLDEDSYNISMGYPVQRTPIYGFFMSLFDAVNSMDNDHIYMPRYLRFVLHPYVKNIYFKRNTEENRKIFHAIEDAFRREKIPAFVRLGEIEEDISNEIFRDDEDKKEKSEQLRYIHDNTIRRFLNFKDIGHFIEECRRVLLFLYKESTAKLHPFFYPYVEAFIKELEKVSLSGLKDMVFEHRESYFNLFKKLTASATVPFEGTPLRGLQILGVLETRNIKFNRVLFLDLNEGVFPDLPEDYILPYQARKALGMPTYEDRERLARFYFDILVGSSQEVYLFYVNNENTERSRFIERLIWEKQKAGIQNILEQSVSYKVKLSTPIPEPIQKTENVINVINNIKLTPSSLDEYLVCGIKFYYSQILRIKKEKDLTGDPDRSEIGNMVHSALKEFFSKSLGRPLIVDKDRVGDIEKIVDSIFNERYKNISGRLYLLKYQIKKRLKELIEYIPELLKNFSIFAVEEKITANLFNTPFECRIDAVGSNGERFIIIDYKTSANEENFEIKLNNLDLSKKITWSQSIKSLQMPLYILLYGGAKGLNLEGLDGYYFLLGKNSIDGNALYNPLKKDIEKTEALIILSEIIKSLVSEIKDPDKPFNPPDDFNKVCKFCDYIPFCGTEWVDKINY